jgi:hypothetical protein
MSALAVLAGAVTGLVQGVIEGGGSVLGVPRCFTASWSASCRAFSALAAAFWRFPAC